MSKRVLIVGGGLAGLAAATALASTGFEITLVEARPRLGGRASSFTDTSTGQLIDACQHVSMGCCTNFRHFLQTLKISNYLEPQPILYFMTPDGRVSTWEAACWPAPLHFAGSFASAHFLSWSDKLRVAHGLFALLKEDRTDDPPFLDWLENHGQTASTIERFWGVVLVSALNEDPSRVGLRYAQQVFVEGFLSDRRGGLVDVPVVPLARLYGEELQRWLYSHGASICLETGVKSINLEAGRAHGVTLRDGGIIDANAVILAVPFDRALALLPANIKALWPASERIAQLTASPITSVHLWYDRDVLVSSQLDGFRGPSSLPHVVLVRCMGQWVFNRGKVASGEHYIQIVVSAARQFTGLGHEKVEELITEELTRLFPAIKSARLVRARVVTEKSATFSVRPGVDTLRPPQRTPIPNLVLAGDWTQTGWPATMEGAVRSGYLAAEAAGEAMGQACTYLQPDLDGVRRYPVEE
jgi:squalene-associated FAD-dependent desaturase